MTRTLRNYPVSSHQAWRKVMRTCLKRALQIAVASGGMFFLGAGIAAASPLDSLGDTSAPDSSEVNHANNLLSVPTTVSDIDVSILSDDEPAPTAAAPAAQEPAALIEAPVTVADV